MMTTLAQATAAPHLVTLKDGKEYVVSPLKDRDLGMLEQWAQDEFVALVKRNCKEDMSEDDRRYHIERAMITASRMSIDDLSVIEKLATPEGAVLMLWLAIRVNHPDMTREQLSELCDDPKQLEDMAQKIIGKAETEAKKKAKQLAKQAKVLAKKKSTKAQQRKQVRRKR